MTVLLSRRPVRVALAVLAQLVLLVVAVWAPVSARLTGQEVRLRVGVVDPMEPMRGAYVQLGYPDLPRPSADSGAHVTGTVYVPLVPDGDLVRGTALLRERPASGPFLQCQDDGWRLVCGIESWFLPQDKATALESAVRDGKAVATVRVDSAGRAALVALDVVP